MSNTKAANALVLWVARSSATIVLNIENKWVLFFHKEFSSTWAVPVLRNDKKKCKYIFYVPKQNKLCMTSVDPESNTLLCEVR